nr:hypothetical protein CFP56_72151 [Quercus suber]
MANTNDVNAATRLVFVKRTLLDTFGFHCKSIDPRVLGNQLIVRNSVDRSKSFDNPSTPTNLPGTQNLPSNESTFIFRLPNSVSGYNDKVRVENEVAGLSLAREALQPDLSHLVPRVYGWASAERGEGWILQQHMSGVSILDEFSSFNAEEKTNVLEQMADILACFQRFHLPDTIDKYGGIGFDNSGQYVSTALSIFNGGPFVTHRELILATVMSKLVHADDDPRVKGWRDNGVRERLNDFLDRGLTVLLRDTATLDRVLVHADFCKTVSLDKAGLLTLTSRSVDNVLFDRTSKKLTALFDFDFSHVSSVADEFFRSLGHGIGRFPCIRDQDSEEIKLHDAMLHGFPSPLPPNTEEVDWTAAKAWDDAIRARNLQRPATIPSMPIVADLFWLSSQILPFKLCNEVVVGNSTDEQLKKRKEEGEALLSSFLTDYGF